jgi:CRP/FNR family transcriptional regulator, cyclic AMP receptor protein
MLATRVSFFRGSPLLKGIRHDDASVLAGCAEVARVPRKGAIWTPGQAADTVFWVRSGIVKVSRVMEQGRDLTLHFHPKGHVFGEGAVFSHHPRHTLAEAYQDAEVYSVSVDDLRRLTRRLPDLERRLAAVAQERRRTLEKRVGVLLFKTAHARLASLLLELGHDFGVRDSRGIIVNLKLTHKEMASLIGATRETVSFAIVDLRKAGLVQTEGKRVILIDEAGLKELRAT